MGVQGERGFIGTPRGPTERALEKIVCKSGVVHRPAMHDLWSARLTVIFFFLFEKVRIERLHTRRRS